MIIQIILAIIGFGILFPCILWGIWNEEKLIRVEDAIIKTIRDYRRERRS
jgi:hypothetical protein